MACVRRSYQEVGLSEGVISILRRSWRESTESAYSYARRQWDSWCLERAIDPPSAPISSILEFLYAQFQPGKQYRTINSFRSASSMEAFYPGFSEEPKLCPVRALKCYEGRSKDLRKKEGRINPLFIATRKPHRPVKACTIGRWLKVVMSQAGIDTKQLTAHSTRGAATSKAKSSGASMADISGSTFARFYHRPVQRHGFGRRVLSVTLAPAPGEL